jgi:hypothetical protein
MIGLMTNGIRIGLLTNEDEEKQNKNTTQS